jgi:hypothetical protein
MFLVEALPARLLQAFIAHGCWHCALKTKAPGCPGVLESSALCTYEVKRNRRILTLPKEVGMAEI